MITAGVTTFLSVVIMTMTQILKKRLPSIDPMEILFSLGVLSSVGVFMYTGSTSLEDLSAIALSVLGAIGIYKIPQNESNK